MKWNRQLIYDEYHKMYIDGIMQGDIMILECCNLSEFCINQIIEAHNIGMSEEYKCGLEDGAGIRKECK